MNTTTTTARTGYTTVQARTLNIGDYVWIEGNTYLKLTAHVRTEVVENFRGRVGDRIVWEAVYATGKRTLFSSLAHERVAAYITR